MAADDQQNRLVRALGDAARYPHPARRVVHRETHISHVLLAGDYAYKIKKPLDLGFLDFSTLERRRHFCEEEIRLNARLAPAIYLDTVAIAGTPDEPRIGGDGEPIEYAVRMRRFDEAEMLDERLATGHVSEAMIDEIAALVARFHDSAATAPPDTPFGTPDAVAAPMRENFAQIAPRLTDDADRARLDALSRWTETRIDDLRGTLNRRRSTGRIRECHGDMHLGNMTCFDGQVAIFDGIEFSDNLRWIDVASDVAFLVMDLDRHGAPALASRFLDGWLAATGDYDALAVIRLYLVYRALVRAKITAIRASQLSGHRADEDALPALRAYLALAEQYATSFGPGLLITRGIAGSGKSTAAAQLVERIGAIRIRSDVERRRLYPDPDPNVRYGPAAHDAVYAHLEALAARGLAAGFPIIADATFLEHDRREPFARLASSQGVPFRILDLDVPGAVAERRIDARRQSGADPSEADRAVMHRQQARLEPLDPREAVARLRVDNGGRAPAVPHTGLAHARGFPGDVRSQA